MPSKRVLIGGSAVPLRDDRDASWKEYGVECLQGWGMTEMSPLGTVWPAQARALELLDEEQLAITRQAGPSRCSASR